MPLRCCLISGHDRLAQEARIAFAYPPGSSPKPPVEVVVEALAVVAEERIFAPVSNPDDDSDPEQVHHFFSFSRGQDFGNVLIILVIVYSMIIGHANHHRCLLLGIRRL